MFLLESRGDSVHQVLFKPVRRLKIGETLRLEDGAPVKILAREKDGTFLVSMENADGEMAKHGHVPLPPYMGREDDEQGPPVALLRRRRWRGCHLPDLLAAAVHRCTAVRAVLRARSHRRVARAAALVGALVDVAVELLLLALLREVALVRILHRPALGTVSLRLREEPLGTARRAVPQHFIASGFRHGRASLLQVARAARGWHPGRPCEVATCPKCRPDLRRRAPGTPLH